MLEDAKKYFQHELDEAVKGGTFFPGVKITDVWFDPKNLLFYCKLEHGGESAYWYIDKPSVWSFIDGSKNQ